MINVYVGIFASNDLRLRADHRGEEAETVRAYSPAAARHKLLYRDVWVEVSPKNWEMIHLPVIRKYPLRSLEYLRHEPDSPGNHYTFPNPVKVA